MRTEPERFRSWIARLHACVAAVEHLGTVSRDDRHALEVLVIKRLASLEADLEMGDGNPVAAYDRAIAKRRAALRGVA